MASGQTANYQLNQWEAEDKVLRTEFNADNAKIDAALAAIPKIVTGIYTGDGSASRFIDLGFTPKAVFVCTQSGLTYSPNASGHVFGGLAVAEEKIYLERFDSIYPGVEIVENGFMVYQTIIDNYSAIQCNNSTLTYHFLAVWQN